MSKTGEEYIRKLNEEEDKRLAKKRLVSFCCQGEVAVGRTPGDRFTPDQPFYICLECDKKCEVFTLDENDEEEA